MLAEATSVGRTSAEAAIVAARIAEPARTGSAGAAGGMAGFPAPAERPASRHPPPDLAARQSMPARRGQAAVLLTS